MEDMYLLLVQIALLGRGLGWRKWGWPPFSGAQWAKWGFQVLFRDDEFDLTTR